MEKRTTIYIDDEDQRAIEIIQADHEQRGTKITASAAIRFALRQTAQRTERRQKDSEKSR